MSWPARCSASRERSNWPDSAKRARPGAVIVDATVGAGGHAAALGARVGPSGRVIGLDRDPEMLALARAATRGLPVTLYQGAYSDLAAVLEELELAGVDGILLDLG